jgi:hypothetical protein
MEIWRTLNATGMENSASLRTLTTAVYIPPYPFRFSPYIQKQLYFYFMKQKKTAEIKIPKRLNTHSKTLIYRRYFINEDF